MNAIALGEDVGDASQRTRWEKRRIEVVFDVSQVLHRYRRASEWFQYYSEWSGECKCIGELCVKLRFAVELSHLSLGYPQLPWPNVKIVPVTSRRGPNHNCDMSLFASVSQAQINI